jgi:hypothetical protein
MSEEAQTIRNRKLCTRAPSQTREGTKSQGDTTIKHEQHQQEHRCRKQQSTRTLTSRVGEQRRAGDLCAPQYKVVSRINSQLGNARGSSSVE